MTNPDMGGGDAGPKITLCPKADDPPLSSGTCAVTAGSAKLLITATVLTPGEVFRGGQVVVDTGKITCVGCDCSSQGAGATQVVCPTGVVSPGLIDTHEHITFQQAPAADTSGERYEQRHDWRKGLRGHTKLSGGGFANTANIQMGELRHLFGGATSVVGSGGTAGILRNLDKAEPSQEGLMQKRVLFQTFPLGDSGGTQLTTGCAYGMIDSTGVVLAEDAYLPHISEGIDVVARNEFLCATSTMNGGQDLSQAQSAFIHSIGLKPADYSLMATEGTALIWSPRSNVRLYGDTAQVTVAARLGVQIALGTDWLPSGSMNMLRELRCADDLNKNYYDHFFSDEQLWMMATANAAGVTATDDVIGIIKTGLTADITIFDGKTNKDHRAVISAEPQDVVLVLRGGKPMYGDQSVVSMLNAGTCDSVDVCGTMKNVCLSEIAGASLASIKTAAGGAAYPLFFCGTAPTNEPSCTPARKMSVMSSTIYTGAASASDSDGDGIPDTMDNCPKVFNPIRPVDAATQGDADGDGVGDACDPCPLTAGTVNCATAALNDADGDGITNALDNCPMAQNTNQADSDMDGKGDVCDACPMSANPGAAGCPASIYDVKKDVFPMASVVSISNALVTATYAQGYFIQTKVGDPGYIDEKFSGIFVFAPGHTFIAGNRLTITAATVSSFGGQKELINVTATSNMATEALPAPIVETSANLIDATRAAQLEGVVVQVNGATVTDIAPAPGANDTQPTNEFVINSGVRVNDLLITYTMPVVNERFTSVTGVLETRNGNYKIEPRVAGDLVLGPPVLVSFGPPSFARTNTVSANTIPTPIMVTLSRAATAATPVTLLSSDARVVVPPTVTIPMGMTSVAVPVTTGALATATPIGINATIDAGVTNVTGTVRVLDGTELPQLLDLQPANASVAAGASFMMTVTLDIPARPGNETVTLTSTSAGTVPASVTVLANATTAQFAYTQTGAALVDTVTAMLGISKMATVRVRQNLIINEIDYDQAGTDTIEFIEIYNPTTNAIDLTNISVVFINGSNGLEYGRVNLSGMLNGDGYLVIAQPAVMVDINATRLLASIDLQNGAPDGVLILDKSNNSIMDALSYEGSITNATIMGVTGTRSLVEGTAFTTADPSGVGGGSLIRNPNGKDTDNAIMDWSTTTTPTPGAPNIKTP